MTLRIPTKSDLLFRLFIPLTGLLLIAWNWSRQTPATFPLQMEVGPVGQIPVFETHWLYAFTLAFTVSFPILFGFMTRPSFYRVIPVFLLANLPVTLLFIAWDIHFTRSGVWGFSASYTTGTRWMGLPWEEWLFFILVPLACTFIYWAVSTVRAKLLPEGLEKKISAVLVIALVVTGITFWENQYTATSAFASAALLLYLVMFGSSSFRSRFYYAFLLSCIPFFLVNGILTGMFTNGPVVLYNPGELSGLRLITIPAEDLMYSFVMLLGNISVFDYLRKRLQMP